LGICFDKYYGVDNYKFFKTSESNISNTLYLEKDDYLKYIQIINRKENKREKENKTIEYDINISGINIHVFENNEKIIYKILDDYSSIDIPIPEHTTNDIFVDGVSYYIWGNYIIENKISLFNNKNKEIVFKKDIVSVFSANLENVKTTQYGLTADSNLAEEELVFFTIPYDKLWDAYIDGEKVDIIKGDNAFIVLDVPAGLHTIELKFNTVYYQEGLKISLVSLGVFTIYGLFELIKKKKKK
jgi:uncharacterized membrane protein YfhO